MSQKKGGFSFIRLDADIEALEEKIEALDERVDELDIGIATRLNQLERTIQTHITVVRSEQADLVTKIEASTQNVRSVTGYYRGDVNALRDLLIHVSAELDEVKKLAQIRRRRKVVEEEEGKELDGWDRMIAQKAEEQKSVKVLEGPGIPPAGTELSMTIIGEKHPVIVQVVTKDEMEVREDVHHG